MSRAGYYAWKKRGPNLRRQTDQLLARKIWAVFLENRKVYASPTGLYGIEASGPALEPQEGSAPDEGKPDCGGALPPYEMEAALQNGGSSQ